MTQHSKNNVLQSKTNLKNDFLASSAASEVNVKSKNSSFQDSKVRDPSLKVYFLSKSGLNLKIMSLKIAGRKRTQSFSVFV